MIFDFGKNIESPNNVGLKISPKAPRLQEGRLGSVEIDSTAFGSLFTESIYESLPPAVIENYEAYLTNTSRFNFEIGNQKNKEELLGEEVSYENKTGMKESGRVLMLDKLENRGIFPDKVLVFRITLNKSGGYHTESYWTTDVAKFIKMYELSAESKNQSNILVSTLLKISENGGVNIDHMDTNGVSLHRLSNDAFNENNILGTCTFTELLTGKKK